MQSSETLDKLAPALVKARQTMGPVHKDQTNSFFSNKYATLGAIVAAALPALLAEGITVIQGGGSADEAGAEVVTRLQHTSGQFIETTIWLPLVGQKIKGGGVEPISPQSAGSANSYGRRYGLAAALCIVADEDDDGEAATAPVRGEAAKPHQRVLPPKEEHPRPRSVESGKVIPEVCPKCGGPVWDNRENKKNPKGPDWTCKDKECKTGKFVTAGWAEKTAPQPTKSEGAGPGLDTDIPEPEETDDIPW